MTSSMTFRGATLSSSSAHQWTYDVFLSFQGADTRHNFTSHLYAALERSKISTYLGDMPDSGAEVSGRTLSKPADLFASFASFDAIEQARTSVIILSENYASSSRCLGELQKILEYKENKGQIVIPVIYKVRNNNFEEAIAQLKGRYESDQIKRWKAALSEVTTLPDVLHLEENGDEAKFIDEIIQKIANHIKAAKHVAKHPDATESPLHVPDSPSSPAQVPDSSSSPSRVRKESPAQPPITSTLHIQAPVQEAKHPIAITSTLHVADSSPAQAPDSSPAQAPDSPRSTSSEETKASEEDKWSNIEPDETPDYCAEIPEGDSPELGSDSSFQDDVEMQARSPVRLSPLPLEEGNIHRSGSFTRRDSSGGNSSNRPPSPPLSPPSGGNGDQGGNPSISRKQGSNSSNLNQGATLMFLIGSVIGILQLDDQFEKHPANMWIALVALVTFCLLHAIITDEYDWAKKYYQIIYGFRVLYGCRVFSGLVVVVSLISMRLPGRHF